jgi:hypothetical protein
VDIFEHDEHRTSPVAFRAEPGEPGEPGELLETRGQPAVAIDRPAAEETIFSLLAARARTRASAHLWLTAGIGGIDALALTIARPALWWIGAACVTVSAYAVWGLADRALVRSAPTPSGYWTRLSLGAVRASAVTVGIVGAGATVVGFLLTALGRGSLGW